MTDHSIEVVKTARYITIGDLNKETKYIWIALHGYGQLANYMAAKLEFLNPKEHFVICPEGLNKFYWHETNQPAACWMTSDNRYSEISNFVDYLDRLYCKYCNHVSVDTNIILFGFSQGCATLWRWIHAKKPRFNVLINWAGWIPEDISYNHLSEYLSDKRIFVLYGNEDKYLNTEVIQKLTKLVSDNELDVQFIEFDGKHQIPMDVLKNKIELMI